LDRAGDVPPRHRGRARGRRARRRLLAFGRSPSAFWLRIRSEVEDKGLAARRDGLPAGTESPLLGRSPSAAFWLRIRSEVEDKGLEPSTSGLQSPRSPS